MAAVNGESFSNQSLSHKSRWTDTFSVHQSFPTVLVIDDDPEVAELVGCFLTREEFRPVLALSGKAGVRLARSLLPSLILCDVSMPDTDGLKVIEALGCDPATAHIPIVLMSGHDAASLDGSGASAFLQKPFHMSEMVHVVRRLLNPCPALEYAT